MAQGDLPGASRGPRTRFKKLLNTHTFCLAVLSMIFDFYSCPPLPRGVPGEGPDCHSPQEIGGFGPIPARIRGAILFLILILALCAAGILFAGPY